MPQHVPASEEDDGERKPNPLFADRPGEENFLTELRKRRDGAGAGFANGFGEDEEEK